MKVMPLFLIALLLSGCGTKVGFYFACGPQWPPALHACDWSECRALSERWHVGVCEVKP